MAIGQASDFKIYEEQFHSGANEVLAQEANVFNASSNGTIILRTALSKGNYVQDSFFQQLSGLVTRQNIGSVAAVTDIAMTQGENVSVKLHRKIGPVAQALKAFKMIHKDPAMMSFILGQQWAKAILVDYMNIAVAAADIAFAQTYSQNNDASTIDHSGLVQAMAKMGDAGKNVSAFVMHSKVYYDLMKQSIADKITDVAGVTIHAGTVASLNRPVIVSDVPALVSAGTGPGGVDEYHTLALTPNAIVVEESEGREIVSDLVTGLEQLALRYQGEYAFNLSLKGYAWDITNGGSNPTDATVKTATNWDKTASDDKNTGGVQLITQ